MGGADAGRSPQNPSVKTLLDDAYTWFLDTLGYRDGCLTMVELIVKTKLLLVR